MSSPLVGCRVGPRSFKELATGRQDLGASHERGCGLKWTARAAWEGQRGPTVSFTAKGRLPAKLRPCERGVLGTVQSASVTRASRPDAFWSFRIKRPFDSSLGTDMNHFSTAVARGNVLGLQNPGLTRSVSLTSAQSLGTTHPGCPAAY